MKTSFAPLLAAALLVLAGCSSTPTRYDAGPLRARTFTFIERTGQPTTRPGDRRETYHQMIQEAITRNLSGRGVTKAGSGKGDLIVAYLVIAGNNATTVAYDEFFGYGDGAALQNRAQSAYTRRDGGYFEAGTLLIDLVDPRTMKIVHRNFASRPILRDLADDARATRIQEVVDEVLRNARITP